MKHFYKFVLLTFVALILPVSTFASHIVGGILTYTYGGTGNTYTVTLKLYRDCSGVAFPGSANVIVLQANGTAFTPNLNFTLPGGTISNLPPVLPPCATTPSVVPCVQERIYTATVSIPPSPGGIHMYYSTSTRNAAAVNILNPTNMGETFYAYIPSYKREWVEDFTLTNGTTVDAGASAWTRTLGTTPPTSAQVNNGEFQIVGSNNGMMVWATQTISIASFTNGVNLSVNVNKSGTNFGNNDSLKIFYAINGGAKVLFPVNGNLVGNWTGPLFAKATGLIGNTIEIFVRAKFNANNNSTGKNYFVDMVSVYDNTFIPNSNPDFSALPPLLFCSTNTFSFSQAAVDLDGDVLVYDMYTPFTHSPAPTFPNNLASIPTVTWAAGYSQTSPFNSGGPAVTLNSTTGIMTGVQNLNGGRVFGIKCSEYRNGLLLSESFRDFEVTAVTCPPFVPSAPGTSAIATSICAGQNLSLTATFTSGANYNWSGPNTFTAAVQNPVVVATTTAASGNYSVSVTVAGCTGPPGTVAIVVNPIPTAPIAGGNTPLCSGQTLSLTATGSLAATYNWSGPNAFTSSTQNPNIAGITTAGAGNYSVTQTVAGCLSPAGTVAIAVNPTPSAPTAGANSPLCQGQNLNLTAAAITGATYSWIGPNSYTANTANPSLSNIPLLGAGVYSVAATVLGCAGPTGTVSVTVNPSPAAPTATTNGPLCTGQNLSLGASFTTGATYNWTGPNAFTASVQNPSIINVSLPANGVYSVNATVAGCAGPTGTVLLTINQTPASPTITANTPLCAGLTLSLTSTFSAAATYSWTGPNSFIANVQNPTLPSATPLATGIYSVSKTLSGCVSPIATVAVNVSIPPSAPANSGNTSLCVGQTLSLAATFSAGLTYSWSGPNGFTSAAINPSITSASLLASGTYSVFATTSGGCSGPISTLIVTVNPIPSAPTASNNGALCEGQTINLTANPGGGSYTWNGPNSFSSTVQNPNIINSTTLATGSYSVRNTVNGCTSLPGITNVTVNSIPTAPIAANNSAICAGQNLSLTATSSGATSYSWTGPNGFSSILQNPIITSAPIAATGNYSVTRLVNGCNSPAAITIVTVNPIPAVPTAASNGTICAGQTLIFSALPNSLSYLWTGPSAFTSTLQNPNITNAATGASGVYSLVVTSLGCSSSVGTVTALVNSTPAAPTAGGTATLCENSNIILSSTNPGGATFSWIGPNSFTSSVQNPTITSALAAASGMYSVTATVLGCTSLPGTFSVSVFANPLPPALNANSPLCTGQNLNLTASSISGASYLWTGPNGFNSALQNPTVTNVSVLAAGNYSVNVNVSGCGSAATVIAVSVNTTPAAPLATNNSSLCAGSTLNLNVNPGGGTYLWLGPDSFTSTAQNPSIVNTGTLNAGTYSAFITVNGCTSPAGITNVTIHPIPAAPTITANNPLCIGQTLTFALSPGGAVYNWSGPLGFSSTLQNPSIASISAGAAGTYSVAQNIVGCVGPVGIIVVTVSPVPPTPTVSSNSPLCALQTLSLNSGPNGSGLFNWTGPNSFTSGVQNTTLIASTVGAGNYSVTQTVLGCTSLPATLAIVVNSAAPTPTLFSNSPICLNGNLSVTQAPISGATYSWSGPSGFTSATQNFSIVNSPTTATGVYSVFATVAGCPGSTSTISILVSQPATVTSAGSTTVCANNSTVALNASSSTGSGNWTSTGSGTFAPNTYTGNYIPSASEILAGNTTLIFSSTNNGGCTQVTTTLNLFITPAPTSSAGSNATVCANNATVSLNGGVSIASGGIWTSSGSGSFVPTNTALSASYIPGTSDLTAGTVTLFLTTSGNGNCLPVADSKVVFFTPAPVLNPGLNPQVVCKSNPNYQLQTTSTTGSASWLSSGTGSFSPNANILNPIYFSSTADTTAGSITLTITSTNNGGCNAVSQTIALIYVSTIAVNAGPTQTVCANNSNVQLNGVSTTSAGVWATSGTGVFTPSANVLNASYTPSGADITSGLVTLTLTTASNGGCAPLTGTTEIIITPGPTAFAGTNQTLCANNNLATLNGSVSLATGALWSSSGTGTFSPNTNSLGVTYFPSDADTTAGAITISLTTTGNGSCFATTSTMSIEFNSAPLVDAGPDLFICKTNPNAILNGYSSTGSGTWLSLGSGTLSTSAMQASYTPSTADTTLGSVLLVFESLNNGNCNPVSDTVQIFYTSSPSLFAGSALTVCANNANVALTGTSSTGSGTWTTSGSGVFSPNTINGTYSPSGSDISAGSFTLTLTSTSNGGCIAATSDLTVFVTPAPTVFAGIDQTVCANSASISLSGTFAISTGVIWASTGSGTFVPDVISANAFYVPSGSDTLNGSVKLYITTSGNGNCLQVVDTVAIRFIRVPVVNAGADISLCPNTSIPQLQGQSSIGTGSWSTLGAGTFSPQSNILNPNYIAAVGENTSGPVSLILTSSIEGCGSVNDTLFIRYFVQPIPDFVSSEKCFGASTQFSNVSIPLEGTITASFWRFNNDTTSILNPLYAFPSVGNQTVMLRVSNGVCTDSVQKIIRINPLPQPVFEVDVLCNDSVRFFENSTVSFGRVTSWNWDFGDGLTSLTKNPIHVFPDTGIYVVNLMVMTDSLCASNLSDTIIVTACDNNNEIVIEEPAVPSGFTPNSDGSNDILFVKGGPFSSLDFRIFNEWGVQIFYSNIQSDGWDGTYKSAEQPIGRFIWTVTGKLINGKDIKMAGEVILNR